MTRKKEKRSCTKIGSIHFLPFFYIIHCYTATLLLGLSSLPPISTSTVDSIPSRLTFSSLFNLLPCLFPHLKKWLSVVGSIQWTMP